MSSEMNNNNTTIAAEASDATAPCAIVALDLAMLRAPVPAEMNAYVAHMVSLAEAIGTAYRSARLPASVSVDVSGQFGPDDADWFDGHPARCYRYRDPIEGEYVLRICAVRPNFVLVRKLDTGARLLAPIWLKSDGATSVERFEAVRNQKKLDDDDVLALVFDVYCAFSGEPADILNLLRSVGQHAWYRMVTQAAHALAPEAPAS
jgi:hypothetical protein